MNGHRGVSLAARIRRDNSFDEGYTSFLVFGGEIFCGKRNQKLKANRIIFQGEERDGVKGQAYVRPP